MAFLWASLALVFGAFGLAFGNGPELVAAAASLGMAGLTAFWRDVQRNHNASAILRESEQRRVEWERHRAA